MHDPDDDATNAPLDDPDRVIDRGQGAAAAAADDGPAFVEVPYDQLAPDTLDRLLADVALRDDTDYGDRPLELGTRVSRARAALERGELVVVFDLRSETASVIPRRELRAREREAAAASASAERDHSEE